MQWAPGTSRGAFGHLSLCGTDVDIGVTGMDKIFPQVDRITLIFHRPQAFDEDERMKLERAAALCPIMANIDADTEVPATFEYGVVATL